VNVDVRLKKVYHLCTLTLQGAVTKQAFSYGDVNIKFSASFLLLLMDFCEATRKECSPKEDISSE